MQIIEGDLFQSEPKNAWVVISTNVGWKRNGENVMGAGVAKLASLFYPDLPLLYGKWCKEKGDALYENSEYRIICIPSKPLNHLKPWLSWQSSSSPNLIRNSYRQLHEWVDLHFDQVVKVPLLGAKNGKLGKEFAMKLITEAELPDNVILVLH